MHLPDHVAEDYRVVDGRESVTEGDTLYYAPDGVVAAVRSVGVATVGLWYPDDGAYTVVPRADVTEGLYSDYFPLAQRD